MIVETTCQIMAERTNLSEKYTVLLDEESIILGGIVDERWIGKDKMSAL